MNTHRTLLTAAALLVSQAASAADFTSTYVGGTRNWSDPASWTTPGAPAGTFPNNGSPSPTTTFDAVQSSGTLTVDVPITIQALTLNNGTNRGAGSLLTLNDTFSWNGGTIDGTGTIQVGGSILLAGGTKSLAARTISLGGNSNWSSGDMSADSGAQIINEADKTFTTSFDGKCDQTTVTASAFVNNGIFTKSGAGGAMPIATGQCASGIFYIVDALDIAQQGYPVTITYPEDGVSFGIEATGVIKGGKNNAEAKQFVDWAASKKFAEFIKM